MISKINDLKIEMEVHVKKCIDNFKVNINKIHVSRVSANMLSFIKVEYYGEMTPLSHLTNSVVESPRTLAVTVFDQNMIKFIEKAILAANLGFNPIISGNIIRITLPILTEDRRHNLIKMVRIEAEKSKISIRNMRRIINDKIKIFLKNKEISEDDEHRVQDDIQNLTNIWIKKINKILQEKESELLIF